MPVRILFTNQLQLLQQKRSFYFLLAGAIIMMIIMFFSGRPLKTSETPAGIIDLELALNITEAEKIILSWKNASASNYNIITSAKMNTWLDFIFLFFYSCFLCSFLLILATKLPYNASFMFKRTSMVILFAGLMDIFENAGMLLTLNGYSNNTIVSITFICSVIKWIIVLSTLILLIYGSLLYIVLVKHKRS